MKNNWNTGKEKSGAPADSRSFFLRRSHSVFAGHPWVGRLLAAVVWLGLWQTAAAAVGQEILLVGPVTVLHRAAELAVTAEFWSITAASLCRIAAGFALAVALGAGLAVLTAFFPLAYAFFSPLLSIVKATPVASFIILALVWLRGNWVPVAISCLMVLPVVWGNVHKGLYAVDRQLLEMARVYRWGRRKTARLLYLPAVLPYFTVACGAGAGLAWKAGIAAEVLGRTANSIGRQIYDSKIYLETADLFAWTAVLILLSVVFEKLFLSWLRRAGRNYGGEEEKR